MARKIRIEYGGACYHVINRGNYRRDLFASAGAADSFIGCLAESCRRFAWRLHGFVVMRNHFHLAVETPEPNLSEGMKWLQGTWAVHFNRFHGETGRPFQGRFKALHVQPGHALAQVVHYIHLNPVRAGIVPAARLLEYRWSSLPVFVRRTRPSWLEARTVLAESGGLADTRRGWHAYVRYLELLAEDEVRRREEKFGRLSRGWLVGSATFGREMRTRLAEHLRDSEPFELLGADPTAQRQARVARWEERLRALAAVFAVDLDRLPAQKSAAPKLLLAAAMKTSTSVSHRWLAERLQMGKPSSIGSLLRRFRLAGGTGQRTFRQVLSRFTT